MFYLLGFKANPEVHTTDRAIDINKAHEKLGHVGEEILHKTMAHYNVKLTGMILACNGCMQVKAQAKNLKKATEVTVTQPGERLYLDASSPFKIH